MTTQQTKPASYIPIQARELSPIFTAEVRFWSPLIMAWASAYKVDPNLIATVILLESCGDPTAVSGSGAQGLFQVMPFHFTAGEDMRDVLTNGRRGMEYLALGLKLANGDPGLALAGYNGGHSKIKQGWAGWSEQTRRYYQWGTNIYADAAKGLKTSEAVDAWLKAGGRRLCSKASSTQTKMGQVNPS
jgi:soluble lytic murein transglycosylase-like protein